MLARLAHARRFAPRLLASRPVLLTGVRHFTIPPEDDDVPDPAHNKHLEKVFEQNEAWRQSQLSEDSEFFNELGSGHKPKYGWLWQTPPKSPSPLAQMNRSLCCLRYLWIGCADARVPANELMGEGAGTVFVHRNVGNQV